MAQKRFEYDGTAKRPNKPLTEKQIAARKLLRGPVTKGYVPKKRTRKQADRFAAYAIKHHNA